MLHFSTLLSLLFAIPIVTAAPTQLNKRIDQNDIAAVTKWEAACNAAKGGAQCNQIAVPASEALLIAAGPCDQQNNADIMMDLSKKLNSKQMITFTQIYVQQPRNSPDSVSVPYCQQKPRNAELNGSFQCQFQGVNPNKFAGGSTLGAPGTIPLGQKAPLNPPGSCPAHPSGPVPDGQQLSDLVQSPGVPGGSGAGNGTTVTQNSSSAPPSTSGSATQFNSSSAASGTNTSPLPKHTVIF